MGTETYERRKPYAHQAKVKLNNPLMGTETEEIINGDYSIEAIKKLN